MSNGRSPEVFRELPLVSLRGLEAGGLERAETVALLSRAASEVGFVYVTDHGVPVGYSLGRRVGGHLITSYARTRRESIQTQINAAAAITAHAAHNGGSSRMMLKNCLS